VALTNPTATNALAKAAYNFRMIPWFKKDQPGNDKNEKTGKEKD
jgi:hypothetical protein